MSTQLWSAVNCSVAKSAEAANTITGGLFTARWQTQRLIGRFRAKCDVSFINVTMDFTETGGVCERIERTEDSPWLLRQRSLNGQEQLKRVQNLSREQVDDHIVQCSEEPVGVIATEQHIIFSAVV